MKYRLGLLKFLNSLPLTHKLRGHPEVEETWGVPAELTSLLRTGKLDAALTSAYEYASRQKNLLSDICIASIKRVETVKIYSNLPLENIRVLEEDPTSLTSNAIIRIIFEERKQRVSFKPAVSPDAPLAEASARLLIGDVNFNPPLPYNFAYDLAGLFWDHFRLPCVYALWQANNEVDGRLRELIEWAFEEAQRDWDSIVSYASKEWNLATAVVTDYFQNVLHYRLTDKDKEFLEFFKKRIHDLALRW